MAIPATGRLMGTPASIMRKAAAADGGHRGGTVGFGDVGLEADDVGEIFLFGKSCAKSALSEFAVADFAASRSADAAHFSDGEWREEVLEVEAVAAFAVEVFKALGHVFSAEGTYGERLRFSAGEEGASVSAGKDRLFDVDRADVFESACRRCVFFSVRIILRIREDWRFL